MGDYHPNVATSSNDLGNIYHRQGMLKEALDLFEKAFTIRKKSLISTHKDLIQTVNSVLTIFLSPEIIELTQEHSNLVIECAEFLIQKDADKLADDLLEKVINKLEIYSVRIMEINDKNIEREYDDDGKAKNSILFTGDNKLEEKIKSVVNSWKKKPSEATFSESSTNASSSPNSSTSASATFQLNKTRESYHNF